LNLDHDVNKYESSIKRSNSFSHYEMKMNINIFEEKIHLGAEQEKKHKHTSMVDQKELKQVFENLMILKENENK